MVLKMVKQVTETYLYVCRQKAQEGAIYGYSFFEVVESGGLYRRSRA